MRETRDRSLKAQGWSTCWGPAISTDKAGLTSGVLIAVRSPATAKQVAIKWIGQEMNHRLVAAVCKFPGRAPTLMLSMYLRVSEGMSPINLEIVASALATADHHQLPYFILGDWNMTAKTILCSGIVHQAAGRLMVPAKATCITSKSATTIDMGMLHHSLTAVVRGPGIREDIECYPHRGLSFSMAGPATKPMATELVVPKRLPVNRIIGPMNQSAETTLLKEKVISHLGEVQRCLNDVDGTGKRLQRSESDYDSGCTGGSLPKIGMQFEAADDAKIQSTLDVLWYHTGGLLWNQVAEMTGSGIVGPMPGEPFKIRNRPMLREHRPAQSWAMLGKPWRWLHQRAHHIRSTL